MSLAIVTPVERRLLVRGAHQSLHGGRPPLGPPVRGRKRRFIKPATPLALLFGERYVQSIEENHRLAVRSNREDYPEGGGSGGERPEPR